MLNDLVVVEMAGVEPASRSGVKVTSTCLFCLLNLIPGHRRQTGRSGNGQL